MSYNWKEKEADIQGDRCKIPVRLIGCTCSACWHSSPMPKELAVKVNDPDKMLCIKYDMVVGTYQEPCESFK